MSNITIDKHAKRITFINNGIGFSQFGVAKEILDLIENQVKEIERLNNNWQKLKDEIKESKKICIANNNDIGISFLDTMLNKIELIEDKNK